MTASVEIACLLIVTVPAVLFGFALRAVLFDQPQPQPVLQPQPEPEPQPVLQPADAPRHAKQEQTPSTVQQLDIRAVVKVFGDTDTSRFTRDLLVGSAA